MLSDVSELFNELAPQPATDRRLSRRLVDHWARASRGRFPSWHAIQAADLGDDWSWAFAVDVEKSIGFPYFVFLGDNLAKLSDVYLCGVTDWATTLLEKACADVFDTVAEEGPVFREDLLTLCDGRRLLFRAVTVPLANDGEHITHVLGAVNGRFTPQVELKVV